MGSNPIVESRIRSIQNSAAIRREKRERASEELAERKANEEQRVTISPRDLERQAQAQEA